MSWSAINFAFYFRVCLRSAQCITPLCYLWCHWIVSVSLLSSRRIDYLAKEEGGRERALHSGVYLYYIYRQQPMLPCLVTFRQHYYFLDFRTRFNILLSIIKFNRVWYLTKRTMRCCTPSYNTFWFPTTNKPNYLFTMHRSRDNPRITTWHDFCIERVPLYTTVHRLQYK